MNVKYRRHFKNIVETFQKHWPIFLIIIVACWLRVWRLQTHLILFGDAARDILAAQESLQKNQLPLLGIPSSIPRFHQGPVSVWLSMFVYILGGDLTTIGLSFALLSVIAVIATYELTSSFISQRAGLLTAALMAISPLAVAHGRTPYHTTPIPLALVLFLWMVLRYWLGKKFGLFWAVLSWAVLFQFELALLPLVLLIPFTWWHQDRTFSPGLLFQSLAGLLLGLLPQIIYDLTHSFSQLGGFTVWVGYRLASFFGYSQAHTASLNKLHSVLTQLWLFGGRIFSTDYAGITLLAAGLLLFSSLVVFAQWKKRVAPPLIKLISLAVVVQLIAYIVHGAPGEAYFPPFIVLLPVLIAYGLSHLSNIKHWRAIVIGCIIWAVFTCISIFQFNFFVSNPQKFSYGPGLAEQRAVLQYLDETMTEPISLASTNNGSQFESYFLNFKLVASEMEVEIEESDSYPVFIENTQSSQANFAFQQRVPKFFPSLVVYVP